MTEADFRKLDIGDIVRHAGNGQIWVIIRALPMQKVAVRTAIMSRPGEWDKVDRKRVRV